MKRLFILTALTAITISTRGQNTTYGGGNAPYIADGGYASDYSPGGTIVLADGSVSLAGGATYEHGNSLFQNSGSWTSASGSTDLFVNAGGNTISGSTAPSFFNVYFNNGTGNIMAITNTQGINIAGQAQFNSGITTTVRNNTTSGSLKFADNASYTGGATDIQHVDGYVSKAGNDAFTYPVGSGADIRTLSISAPVAVTDQYSVAWIAGDPGSNGDPSDANALHPTSAFIAPISSVSTQGQWDWVPVSGTGAGLTITVSLPSGVSAAATGDLRLVGWNGAAWVDLSGGPTASGNTEGAILSGTMIAGITAIGIGSTSVVLPVTFGGFSVHKRDCEALLSWTTLTEQHNDFFAVERSADGRDFAMIGKVAAAGNSSIAQNYSYYDKSPVPGLNYYRIVQIDIDGQRSSSVVKSLRFNCTNGTIMVYPTVTRGTLHVLLPAGFEQATIFLSDISGRIIKANIQQHGLMRTLYLPALAEGSYLLRVEHTGVMETFKILYRP